jgi:hypothetical protein
MSEQSTVSALNPSPGMIDTMTRVIMSQTDMTEEEVKIALEYTNYDLKRVIREYMRGERVGTVTSSKDMTNSTPDARTNTTMSTNQLRFSEIRNFMDKSAQQYYRQQEMTKIYNQVMERKKAAAAAAAEAGTATPSENETVTSETTSKL